MWLFCTYNPSRAVEWINIDRLMHKRGNVYILFALIRRHDSQTTSFTLHVAFWSMFYLTTLAWFQYNKAGANCRHYAYAILKCLCLKKNLVFQSNLLKFKAECFMTISEHWFSSWINWCRADIIKAQNTSKPVLLNLCGRVTGGFFPLRTNNLKKKIIGIAPHIGEINRR